MEDIRTSAQRAYETDSTGIMEASRADAEADALSFLAQAQQSDAGFKTADPTAPPINPGTRFGQMRNKGGVIYIWNGNEWEKAGG